MEKIEFQKLCKNIFKRNGFIARGNNFYFETDSLFLVFGLQHSFYGSYYYIEYGVAVKATNPYMPWPKYYQVDYGEERIEFCFDPDGDTEAVFYDDAAFNIDKFTEILESSIQFGKSKLKNGETKCPSGAQ